MSPPSPRTISRARKGQEGVHWLAFVKDHVRLLLAAIALLRQPTAAESPSDLEDDVPITTTDLQQLSFIIRGGPSLTEAVVNFSECVATSLSDEMTLSNVTVGALSSSTSFCL